MSQAYARTGNSSPSRLAIYHCHSFIRKLRQAVSRRCEQAELQRGRSKERRDPQYRTDLSREARRWMLSGEARLWLRDQQRMFRSMGVASISEEMKMKLLETEARRRASVVDMDL